MEREGPSLTEHSLDLRHEAPCFHAGQRLLVDKTPVVRRQPMVEAAPKLLLDTMKSQHLITLTHHVREEIALW